MVCDYSADCEYYATHKKRTAKKQYQLLIESYCEGTLQAMCRRMKFREEKGTAPPAHLCPNGYSADNHKKVF